MSFSADPLATVAVEFVTFDDRRVKLEVKFLTSRETTKHAAAVAGFVDRDLFDDSALEHVKAAIEIGVVSPTFDELQDAMTRRDLVLLAQVYPSHLTITESEMGKSRSRLLLRAGDSAATAIMAAPQELPATSS